MEKSVLLPALEAEIADISRRFIGTRLRTGEAMRYALSSGGKRLRPVLLMEFCRAYGGDVELAVPVAVALECIHTFSLVHDDLPCMDDDDYRRGRSSTHAAFGEAPALLAGDALSIFAFGHIAEHFLHSEKHAHTGLRLIAELSRASGLFGMCGGQDLDLSFEEERPDSDDLQIMYQMKTGALIRFACRAGVIIADAGEDAIENASEYARDLGLAFQLMDDISDIREDASVGKASYVSLRGEDVARRKAAELTERALSYLINVPENMFLNQLTLAMLGQKKR